ncbi:hypothetical protein BH10BAC3_BH10BAC3_16670 [soil metagenome]
MKNLLIAFIGMLLFANCNSQSAAVKKEDTSNKTAAQNESPADAYAEKSASIKIFKDDKLVVEYKALFPQGGITTYKSGEKDLVLKLSTDDNTINLIVTLEKTISGNYSIGKPGLGQASILLNTEGKPALPYLINPTEGTFKITITGETCSGNFTASQKETGSDNIKITGEFTSIPLMKENSKY